MKSRTIRKKIYSVVLAISILVSMACVGFTANAASMTYHIDTTKKASLTLHKYEMPDTSVATFQGTGEASDEQYVPENAKPLANVEFTIKKVSELSNYFKPDGISLPSPTEAKAMAAINTYTATTGADGVCTFTNLPLGIYYVEETNGPAQITQKVAPFVVSLPLTDKTGTKWLYDVTCFPKNQTAYGGVTLQKIDSATKAPLAGAKFTLYKSSDKKTYTEFMTDITTNDNGTATVSNLPSQTYYKFVETQASDASYILDSTVGYEFYVDGTGDMLVNDEVVENRTITVGNDTVTIHKYVLDGAGVDDNGALTNAAEGIDNTADYGDTVHWKIKTSVPTNVNKLTTYKVIDTINVARGLSYKSATVWLDNKTKLTVGSDYTENNDTTNNTVTFSIKPSVLVNAKEVEVFVDTTLTSNAPMGVDISNSSSLTYTNNVGTDSTYTKDSEKPTVHTGGYAFKKTDGNTPLAGAKFAIYATEADAKEGKNALLTKTSDSNGLVYFKGLKYGAFSADEAGKNKNGAANGSTDYWLAEIDAPDGYILLSAPVKVTVNAGSHKTANNTDVINTLLPTLPVTGAVGTAALITLSLALIISGTVLFFRKRKREE